MSRVMSSPINSNLITHFYTNIKENLHKIDFLLCVFCPVNSQIINRVFSYFNFSNISGLSI